MGRARSASCPSADAVGGASPHLGDNGPVAIPSSWSSGPHWDDPGLTALAAQLRQAHVRIAPLPAEARRRLHRQLLAITDLAKRDHELAARRLTTFLADLETGPDPIT